MNSSRSKHRPILLGVFIFSVGIGVGILASHQGKSEVAPYADDDEDESNAVQEDTTLPKRINSVEVPGGPRLNKLQALSELNDVLENKIVIRLFAVLDHLNQDFIALFELSSAEVAKLENAIAEAKKQLAFLEAENSTIEVVTPDEIVFSIAEFPTEGGKVFDQFTSAIRETLGETRYSHYEKLSSYDYEQSTHFGQFGLASKRITVGLTPESRELARTTVNTDPLSDTGAIKTSYSIHTYPRALKHKYPLLYKKLVNNGTIETNE